MLVFLFVEGLDFLLHLLEFKFELVDFAVDFIDESIATFRLRRERKESKVVLIGLYFIGEDVALAEELVLEPSVVVVLHLVFETGDSPLRSRLAECSIETVHLRTECLVDVLLLLERHESHVVPIFLRFSELRSEIALFLFRVDGGKFLNDGLLLGKVLFLLRILCGICLFLRCEERIASRIEALPNFVAVFLWHGAYLFPFLLECDDGISGFSPFGAVLERLRLLTEFLLELVVGVETLMHILDKFRLLVEEIVAGSAEAFENLDVHLLRCESHGFPFLLEGNDFIRLCVPLCKSLERINVDGLNLLAESRFLLKILVFLLFAGLEEFLMFLVDYGRCRLESVPQ